MNLNKEEAIAFADWLWKNVDEHEMSVHDWEYFYDIWRKSNESSQSSN